MIKLFLQRLLIKNKALILKESINMRDFMNLLMKRRNATDKWTKEEIHQIKAHLVHLSLYVPVLIVFVLPAASSCFLSLPKSWIGGKKAVFNNAIIKSGLTDNGPFQLSGCFHRRLSSFPVESEWPWQFQTGRDINGVSA